MLPRPIDLTLVQCAVPHKREIGFFRKRLVSAEPTNSTCAPGLSVTIPTRTGDWEVIGKVDSTLQQVVRCPSTGLDAVGLPHTLRRRGRCPRSCSFHFALLGVNAMAFKLNVNGKSTTVDVPGDTPLLWVIRDILNLKATKYGCGIGQCRACTLHQTGKAVPSCQPPVSAVGNQPVTTLEGLSPNGTHAVQIAWQEIDVPQCGYCQVGQMMSAAALLAKNPKPSDKDIIPQ